MGGSGSEEEMEGQTKSMGYESQCLLVPGESQRQAGSWDMNQPAPIGDASVMSSSLVCYTRSLLFQHTFQGIVQICPPPGNRPYPHQSHV